MSVCIIRRYFIRLPWKGAEKRRGDPWTLSRRRARQSGADTGLLPSSLPTHTGPAQHHHLPAFLPPHAAFLVEDMG